MKSVAALVSLVAVSPACADETASPISKVLEMISGLQAKIMGEGTEAQKVYDDFAEWCEDTAKQLQFEVKTGKEGVAELQAKISQEASTIESLTAKVEELAENIATDESDLKAATGIRNKEEADFAKEDKELMSVIETLGRAIGILEREMAKGGASMMQIKNAKSLAEALGTMVQASVLSMADGDRLTALLQGSQAQESESSDDSTGAPAAAVYEGHSGGILDVLGGLSETAQTQLDEARKTETTAIHNFEQLKQSLEDNIKFANEETAAAKKGLAKSGESKAGAEGDLSVTAKDLATDTKDLSDLHHNCMKKAQEFEAETKSRGEELEALATAKKIISETTGGAASQSYSFLQTRARSDAEDQAKLDAVHYVRELSKQTNSLELAQLSERMGSVLRVGSVSGGDVFAKVKGLINNMLEKLLKEAEDDATEKAYCDKELAYTNGRKDEKTTEIEKQTTSIDQMTARSSKLKEEVATLQKELSELAKSKQAQEKMRAEEKAVYDKSRAEMEQGLNGIKAALKVLRDYYAQQQENSAQGSSTGIIGLLEVCESDFSKGLAELIATEESAVAEFEQEMKDNEISTASKNQDVEYKTKEHVGLDKTTTETKSDRAGVQVELDAIMKYLKGLEARCIAKAESYESIVARRNAELAGLKEALTILEGEGVSFSLAQKSASRRTLRGVQKH
jgi:DNA repair exonuclease SbcCD ATPase subunit